MKERGKRKRREEAGKRENRREKIEDIRRGNIKRKERDTYPISSILHYLLFYLNLLLLFYTIDSLSLSLFLSFFLFLLCWFSYCSIAASSSWLFTFVLFFLFPCFFSLSLFPIYYLLYFYFIFSFLLHQNFMYTQNFPPIYLLPSIENDKFFKISCEC